METLQEKWNAVFFKEPQDLIHSIFRRLVKSYQSRTRHYHNLDHLTAMLGLSDSYASHLQQKDVVDLAIFYHDVIYNPLRKDNEERSARQAVRELSKLQLPKEKIQLIETYILATKTHDLQGFDSESDLAYFLDFDLAVLGADREIYETYAHNIRSEYHIYPDFMYNTGRSKVLQHFLDKPSIYFTAAFRADRETRAKENMEREWRGLQKVKW